MRKDSSYSSRRLTFRGMTRKDADNVVRWRSDPDNYKFFFGAHALSMKEHLEWFEKYMRDETRYDFVIEDTQGRPIGTVGLSSIAPNSCEISYMIGDKEARGLGYATEAVRAMTQVAISELGIEEVTARIKPDNEASVKVATGGGFVEVERVFRFAPPRCPLDEQREYDPFSRLDAEEGRAGRPAVRPIDR